MTYRKCRTRRCGFNVSRDKRHCPNCGSPPGFLGRVAVLLRLIRRQPNLSAVERRAWSVVDTARDEWRKLEELEGELTGYHKPKMAPEQKAALEKARSRITSKARPALQRIKEIEAARWQNAWIPVAMQLVDDDLGDAELAEIDRQLYLHTRAGSALNKRWRNGVPGYEGLFDAPTRSLEPSIFGLAVTIIRIREWISVRRTIKALGEISSFSDDHIDMEELPSNGVSDWVETIFDRNEELERLTQETIRLDAEEDVDRLIG